MVRDIRVCCVIQAFRPRLGGAQIQLERLLPRLAERGVEVMIFTRSASGAARREEMAGAQVRRSLLAGDAAPASAGYILEGVAHLTRQRRRYRIIHAHGALSEGAIALWGDALGIPALVKVLRAGVEGDLQTLARRPGGRQRLRRLLRRAWFVAVSEEIRSELEQLGAPAHRVFDIPNGVDTSVFRPVTAAEKGRLRGRLGLPSAPLLVYTGRLDRVKRVEVLVHAVATTPGCGLVVVGDGPDRPRLETTAHALGARDRVDFRGRVEDVSAYLRACDAFVTASPAEGLSNALMEALACGLPCLAVPASGVSGLLADGCGTVVGDDAAWPQAIATVLADPERAALTGARAAELVRARFALAMTADRLVAAYGRMLQASGAPGR